MAKNRDLPALQLPEGLRFPAAMVNITNRCNLRCRHCFVFREGSPHATAAELEDDVLAQELRTIQAKHAIHTIVLMGGEPLVKRALLEQVLPFIPHPIITTNGTIPLRDFSAICGDLLYVVSLDGPEAINDELRGDGVFARVMKNLEALPAGFPHTVQCQTVVTRSNQDHLESLVDTLRHTRFHHMTFSFYVPSKDDQSAQRWETLEERDGAIEKVIEIVRRSDGFVRNRLRSLEMMLSRNNPSAITSACPATRAVLPLYLDAAGFVTPFCCYGNNVSCDACGGWIVFELAARAERADWEQDPWFFGDRG